MGNLNPFHDKEFLKQLDSNRNRQVYVRIIALDLNENPLEEIFGQITSGSLNIDGSSCVRRTCSLSMIANELNINEYLWGLKSKFKCEIGLYNTINQEKYPEIIWFPQGVYYITSFNTSQNLTGWTVSISGKDKMCMLNGDLGGNITAISVNFGEITEIDNTGHQTKTKIHLKEIIKQAVHEYGKEPYHNIIIEDLDEAALELLEYRGIEDMYLIYDHMTDSVSDMDFNPQEWYYNKDKQPNGTVDTIYSDELDDEEFIQHNNGLSGFDHRIELDFDQINEPVHLYPMENRNDAVEYNENYKTILRIQTGETVGYRLTDLTYAGDLIGNCGESITSACLDKIKNMLGDYEYFYDLQGHFIWRRKPTYINISWNNIEQSNDNERYAESAAYTSAITYSFENSNLITAFTNTPNINDVKNDYSIFGSRKLNSGTEVPVHIRYAIDKKPTYYKSYSGQVFYSKDHLWPDGQVPHSSTSVNKDYFRKSYMPDFLTQEPYGPYDWWEAYDWAQYWSYITTGSLDGGGVPTRGMSDYWTEYTKLDLNTLYNTNAWANWENHNLFLYDVKYDNIYINDIGQEIAEGPHLGFTGHNPWIGAPDTYTYSCGHQYSYILSMRQQNTRIYFYKPSIPEADLTPEAIERINDQAKQDGDLEVDWREIIYQMARDYMKHSQDDDFLEVIRHNNPISYPTGYTGYEQYYTDMISFWRELYNGGGIQYPEFKVTYTPQSIFEETPNNFYHFVDNPGYIDGKTATIPLYIQNIYGQWQPSPYVTQEEYNATPEAFFLPTAGGDYNNKITYYTIQESSYITANDIEEKDMESQKYLIGWAKAIFEDPSKLNFWIDFLDTEGELSQFSVNRIGNRPLSQNDTNLKAVYYKEVPTTIFIKSSNPGELTQKRAEKQGYTFISINENQEYLFKISTQHQSCKDKLNQELYKHAICQESISITAIPIYYLEPNTRIFVTDQESGINGEYIVSKISYSLAYNGTMNITATKAANNLF